MMQRQFGTKVNTQSDDTRPFPQAEVLAGQADALIFLVNFSLALF
jgi:hypothetical protein